MDGTRSPALLAAAVLLIVSVAVLLSLGSQGGEPSPPATGQAGLPDSAGPPEHGGRLARRDAARDPGRPEAPPPADGYWGALRPEVDRLLRQKQGWFTASAEVEVRVLCEVQGTGSRRSVRVSLLDGAEALGRRHGSALSCSLGSDIPAELRWEVGTRRRAVVAAFKRSDFVLLLAGPLIGRDPPLTATVPAVLAADVGAPGRTVAMLSLVDSRDDRRLQVVEDTLGEPCIILRTEVLAVASSWDAWTARGTRDLVCRRSLLGDLQWQGATLWMSVQHGVLWDEVLALVAIE